MREIRDSGDGSTVFGMFFAYAVIVIAMFYLIYIFNQSSFVALRENVDNVMSEANLSSMIFDMEKFSYYYDEQENELKTKPYLIDTQEIYNIYSNVLCQNLLMDEHKDLKFTPQENSRWNMYLSEINVTELVVFDVVYLENGKECITARDINGWRELVYNQTKKVYELGTTVSAPSYCDVGDIQAPDGTLIESPSIYSQLELKVSSKYVSERTFYRHNTTSIILSTE